MALTLSKTGIAQTSTINAWHVTQSVDALTGTAAYDITISGSLDVSNATVTGDLVGTASWASNAVLATNATSATDATNATNATKLVASNNYTTNVDYNVPFAATSSATYEQFFKENGSEMTYNPSSNTLTVTNFAGTASHATYAETSPAPTYLSSTIYPSGSVATPNSVLQIIAGAAETDVTSTAGVTVNELAGKTLNQNCFITATAEDSATTTISVDPSGIPPNLSFKSSAPNTKFHFHIMYI